MCLLNEDILRQIVYFISSETLASINSTHPVFYEAWMKSRYATLTLAKRDEEMKRLLAHLRESSAAMHVKQVEIRPWLVQPRTKSPRSLTENLVVRFLQLLDPHYTKKKAEQRLQKRLRKDTANVTAAFQQMINVEQYTIEWDDDLPYHPEFYKAFLTPALETWSSQLVVLKIKVPPFILSSLARVRLPKLEEFTFHFSTGILSFNDIDNAHDGFVVFVNNLKDSLRSLTFTSTHTSQELDMTRIFRKMGYFPSLKKVTLSIPFDGAHLSDPMTFVLFLEKHRTTLKDLNLFAGRCTPRSKPGDPEFINWIQRIIGSPHTPFPQLRGLGVALRPLRAPLDVLIQFLDMHSSTLDSLTLTDRVLNASELRRLFRSVVSGQALAVAEGITNLQVRIDAFSASFLASMAGLFPNLKTLKIECQQVLIDNPRLRESAYRQRDISPFSANLSEIRDSIAGWDLQHLAIGPKESHWARAIEEDLLDYFPNLTVSDFDS
ncbi:hypothetical protein GALMADRAFT_889202 [Galerina marginata CBS 339.88]|uniref:F-box domain-containing protein n=1 Tax=Galerina marginata (strain CBS 339.88) TaxID=685588 RepID=A0A067STQ9_GALM3|nr:hypothetical protein GALMADRAFT_889202 [Galerina marginata CBS 339.88]